MGFNSGFKGLITSLLTFLAECTNNLQRHISR